MAKFSVLIILEKQTCEFNSELSHKWILTSTEDAQTLSIVFQMGCINNMDALTTWKTYSFPNGMY